MTLARVPVRKYTKVSPFHQHNLPAVCFQVSLPQTGPILFAQRITVDEFPPIIQVDWVSNTTLRQRDANNIQGTSFGYLDQFVFFFL